MSSSDLQIVHLGGLIQAALNADTAASCRSVIPYPIAQAPPAGQHPCLVLFRKQNRYSGLGGRRTKAVEVFCGYFLGPTAGSGSHQEDGWGILDHRADVIDDVLLRRRLGTYPAGEDAGKSLLELAHISEVALETATFGVAELGATREGEYPAVELLLRMEHQKLLEASNATDLTKIVANFNLDGVEEGTFGYHIVTRDVTP